MELSGTVTRVIPEHTRHQRRLPSGYGHKWRLSYQTLSVLMRNNVWRLRMKHMSDCPEMSDFYTGIYLAGIYVYIKHLLTPDIPTRVPPPE